MKHVSARRFERAAQRYSHQSRRKRHDILGARFGLPTELGVTRSNILYLLIGALIIAVAVMGYQLYQDRHQPEGLHINVGPGGLSIQGK